MENLTCSQARQFDMVTYLAALGYKPQKIRNNDYWYLSPLRDEKTPSFKVNRKLNTWYDHGTGEGGNLIDFGTRHYGCSVKELLTKLENYKPAQDLFFHLPTLTGQLSVHDQPTAGEKKTEETKDRIVITQVKAFENAHLLSYLQSRNISPGLAKGYCQKITFQLYQKTYTAIGFRNDAGGFELRSESFQGSASPKGITLFKDDTNQKTIHVLEGFSDFLSLLTMERTKKTDHYLILNSLSFINKVLEILKTYDNVLLYLDHDPAGRKATTQMLKTLPQATDASQFYIKHNDLNDYLRLEHPRIERQHQPQKIPLVKEPDSRQYPDQKPKRSKRFRP